MSLVTANKNRALDQLLPQGCSCSLHASGAELAGKGYGRQRIIYSPANNGVKSNAEAVTFAALPEATVEELRVWHPDGSPIWAMTLEKPEHAKEGGVITFPTGHIMHILK